MTQLLSQIDTNERTLKIVELLTTTSLTHEQIAKKIGVSRSTLERDIRQWLNSEEFNTYFKQEWLSLHQEIKQSDPKECYRALTQLIKRSGDGPSVNAQVTQINIVFGQSPGVPDRERVVEPAEYSAESVEQ